MALILPWQRLSASQRRPLLGDKSPRRCDRSCSSSSWRMECKQSWLAALPIHSMQLRPPQTLRRVGVEKGIVEAARLCFQLLQHRAGGFVELRREEIGFPVTVAGLVAMPLRRAAPKWCSAD